MLVCFFEHKGIVHYEFISQGQTVNQHLFGIADKVTGMCLEEKPRLWPDKWILNHDNAPEHDVVRVHEFLAKNFITKVDHPPYSSDLALCDFWLFPKLKIALKRQRFADLSDIQRKVKNLLCGIPEIDFENVCISDTIIS